MSNTSVAGKKFKLKIEFLSRTTHHIFNNIIFQSSHKRKLKKIEKIVNEQKKNKKNRKTWMAEDESLLVEVWADKLADLRGQRKNSHIYKEMEEILCASGAVYTALEIKIKLHNLTNRYRKEKKLIGPSGGSPSEWPLYMRVHEILGELKINNLEDIVEDSIAIDHGESNHTEIESSSEPVSAESWSFPFAADTSTNSIEIPTPDVPPLSAARKRKRVSTQIYFDDMKKTDDLISEQLKIIKESDERMIAIEDRRNSILERMVLSCESFQKDIFNMMVYNEE